MAYDPLLAEQNYEGVTVPGTLAFGLDPLVGASDDLAPPRNVDPLADRYNTQARTDTAYARVNPIAEQGPDIKGPSSNAYSSGLDLTYSGEDATNSKTENVPRDSVQKAVEHQHSMEARRISDELRQAREAGNLAASSPEVQQKVSEETVFDAREAKLARGEFLTKKEYEEHYKQDETDPRKVMARNGLKDDENTRTQLAFRDYLIKNDKYSSLEDTSDAESNILEADFIKSYTAGQRQSLEQQKQAILDNAARTPVPRGAATAVNQQRKAQLAAIDNQIEGLESTVERQLTGFDTSFYREFPFASSGGGKIGLAPKKDQEPTNRDEGRDVSPQDKRKTDAKAAEVPGTGWGRAFVDTMIVAPIGGVVTGAAGIAAVGATAVDRVAGTRWGDTTAGWLTAAEKVTQENYSEETKRQASALGQGFEDAFKEKSVVAGASKIVDTLWQNSRGLTALLTGSAGQVVPAIGTAVVAGAGAPVTAVVGVAGMAGGIAETTGAKIADAIQTDSFDNLKLRPAWYEVEKTLRKELSAAPTDEQIRDRLASDTRMGSQAVLYALSAASLAAGGGLASGVTGRLGQGIIAGPSGKFSGLATAGLKEALTEGVESGVQKSVELNTPEGQKLDPKFVSPTDPRILGDAALGFVAGGIAGPAAKGIERAATRSGERAAIDPLANDASTTNTTTTTADATADSRVDPVKAQQEAFTAESKRIAELAGVTPYRQGALELFTGDELVRNAQAPGRMSPKEFEARAAEREAATAAFDEQSRLIAAEEGKKQYTLSDAAAEADRVGRAMAPTAAAVVATENDVATATAYRDKLVNQQANLAFVDNPLQSYSPDVAQQRAFDLNLAEVSLSQTQEAAVLARTAHETNTAMVLAQVDADRASGKYIEAMDSAVSEANALLREQAATNGRKVPVLDRRGIEVTGFNSKANPPAPSATADAVVESMTQKDKAPKQAGVVKSRDPLSMLESRDAKADTSIDPKELQGAIDSFNLASNRVKVQVVETAALAPDNVSADARGYVKRSPDGNNAEIVLIRENIPDIATARAVITEEAINHHGVLGMLSEGQLNAVTAQLAGAIQASPQLRSLWKNVQDTYSDKDPIVKNVEMLSEILNNPEMADAKGFTENVIRPFLAADKLPGMSSMTAEQIKTIRALGEQNSQNPNAEAARVRGIEMGVGISDNHLRQRQVVPEPSADFLIRSKIQKIADWVFDVDRPVKATFEFIAQSPIEGAQNLAAQLHNTKRAIVLDATIASKTYVAPHMEAITDTAAKLDKEAKSIGIKANNLVVLVDKRQQAMHALEWNWLYQAKYATFKEGLEGNRAEVTKLINEVRDFGTSATPAQFDAAKARLRELVNDNTVTDDWKLNTPDSMVHPLGAGLNNHGARAVVAAVEASKGWQLPAMRQLSEDIKGLAAADRQMLGITGRINTNELGGLFDMTHYLPQKGGAEAKSQKLGSIYDSTHATYDRRQVGRTNREKPAENGVGELIAMAQSHAIDLGGQSFDRALALTALTADKSARELAQTNMGEAVNLVKALRNIVTITPNVKFRQTDEGTRLFDQTGEPIKLASQENVHTVMDNDGNMHILHLKSGELQKALSPQARRDALGLNENVVSGGLRSLTRGYSQAMTSTLSYATTNLERDAQQVFFESVKLNGLKGANDARKAFFSVVADGAADLASQTKGLVTRTDTLGTVTNAMRNYDMDTFNTLKAASPADFAKGGKWQYAEDFMNERVLIPNPNFIQNRDNLSTALQSDRSAVSIGLGTAKEGVQYLLEKQRVPFDQMELAFRMGYYTAGREAGMSSAEAGQFAIRQIDFAQKSALGQKLNMVIPFSQTALSGADAMVQNRIWSNGKMPTEFVTQPDGSQKQVMARDWYKDLSTASVAATTARAGTAAVKFGAIGGAGIYIGTGLLAYGLARGLGGNDDQGRSMYSKVDGDVTANNTLVWNGSDYNRIPMQDNLQGILQGIPITWMRAAQGDFSAQEAMRITYNSIRRHYASLGNPSISDDDMRRHGSGIIAALAAQLHGLTPPWAAPVSNNILDRDSFGRQYYNRIDQDGEPAKKNPPLRNAVEEWADRVSAGIKANYGKAVDPRFITDTLGAVLGPTPFGADMLAQAKLSGQPERGNDPDNLDQTPAWLRRTMNQALKPETTGRTYDYRKQQEFIDENVMPLEIMRSGAKTLDRLNGQLAKKDGKADSGPLTDAFDEKHPELGIYDRTIKARSKVMSALTNEYRVAFTNNDSAGQAAINRAREAVGNRALEALELAKVGKIKEAEAAYKGLVKLAAEKRRSP